MSLDPFDPGRTAVVVVDMQNGFCHPDGSLYAPPSQAAIAPVSDLVSQARDAGERDAAGRAGGPAVGRYGEQEGEETDERRLPDSPRGFDARSVAPESFLNVHPVAQV